MLLVQTISLSWNKETRQGNFVHERNQFPQAYPIQIVPLEKEVVVYPLDFYQTKQGIVTIQSLLEKSSPTKSNAFQRGSQYVKPQFYSSIQEVNLKHISFDLCQNALQVVFCWQGGSERAKPFRQGHNKDYLNLQSPLYMQNRLNEIAFTLQPAQYGRVLWNERLTDIDTGQWYYKTHTYNIYFAQKQNIFPNLFSHRSPDYLYKQIANLY